jgi:hypothetical protein
MERRKAIKNIGLSFGAFIATPTALSFLQSCGSSMEPWTPAFLSEDQGKMLRKVVDGIIPAIDDFPSASGVGVHAAIDKYLDEVMPLEDRESFMTSLGQVYDDMLASTGESSFDGVSPEQVDAYLNENLKKTEEELEAMRAEMTKIYFGEAEITELPEGVQQDMFLINLRDMAISAYKQSEVVGKNILAYDPVPGEFIGCGDLQELTGGRGWTEG